MIDAWQIHANVIDREDHWICWELAHDAIIVLEDTLSITTDYCGAVLFCPY